MKKDKKDIFQDTLLTIRGGYTFFLQMSKFITRHKYRDIEGGQYHKFILARAIKVGGKKYKSKLMVGKLYESVRQFS